MSRQTTFVSSLAAIAVVGVLGMTGCASTLPDSVAGNAQPSSTTHSQAATASAAPPATDSGSYVVHSANYNVGPYDHPTHSAMCADGYHVDGSWIPLRHSAYWSANVTPYGDDIYIDDSGAGEVPNGGTTDEPTYQGVDVKLGNRSLTSTHGGSFSWTCDPN